MADNTIETIPFQAHQNLLKDVFLRQAGSLTKALVEAVMNAVDAEATQVAVTVSQKRVRIQDNGRGIQTRQEIKDHFVTVGTPHEASEKKIYGEFRMGRGQLFAYGANTWVTGPWTIGVDVKKNGITCDLQAMVIPATGTTIDIELYDELPNWRIADVCNSLREHLAHIPITVLVNDEVIMPPPVDYWTADTPQALIHVSDADKPLTVYNLGVLVKTCSARHYGVGGVVVSKEKLRVNYARNDIIDDCPVWKQIEESLRGLSAKSIRNKQRLTEPEKSTLRRHFASGQVAIEAYMDRSLITLANGQSVSFRKLINAAKSGTAIAAAYDGDTQADLLIRQGKAIVLGDTCVRDLGFSLYRLEQLSKWLSDTLNAPILVQSLSALDVTTDYRLLTPDELSADERFWFKMARDASSVLCLSGTPRAIFIGDGDCLAWTDGQTYIALSKTFVKSLTKDFKGIYQLGAVLLHEYCHENQSSTRHDHGHDFYETYHNAVLTHLPEYLETAATLLSTRSPRKGSKKLLNQITNDNS